MTKLKSNEFEIRYKDMPMEFMESTAKQIHSFSTPLIRLRNTSSPNSQPQQIGSATFVTIEDQSGLLTAYHVAEELLLGDRLGIVVQPEGKEHHFSMDVQELNIVCVADYFTWEYGPDLAFITLPKTRQGIIRANKTFYNLTKNRPFGLEENQPAWNQGMWFLCGVPDEHTKTEKPEKAGFRLVKSYSGLAGATGPEKEFEKDGFDYIDTLVTYDEFSEELPKDFGGNSGGGIWRVFIAKEDGKYTVKRYFLTGVIFCQINRSEKEKVIRGHGRKSLYRVTYDKLISTFNSHTSLTAYEGQG